MPDRPGAPHRAWQRMLSGRRLDLLDPSPLDVEVEDIAHGLARVARWNGQTVGDHAFSVAQHSLLVEHILCLQHAGASPHDRLATLLHDAPEYVIGDMISPFKAVLDDAYKSVEERLQAAVQLRFGLPPRLPRRAQPAHQEGRPGRRLSGRRCGSPALRRRRRRAISAGRDGSRPDAIGRFLDPWPAKRGRIPLSGACFATAALAAATLPAQDGRSNA